MHIVIALLMALVNLPLALAGGPFAWMSWAAFGACLAIAIAMGLRRV